MNQRQAAVVVSGPGSSSLWVDQVGAGLSIACAIHCLATPFLVAILSLFGLGFLVDEMTEVLFVCTSVILAIGSLCWGFRIHRSRRMLLLLGAAILLITVGRLFAEETSEIVLVVFGAALLATSHLLNRHLCRTCLQCDHPQHQTGQ